MGVKERLIAQAEGRIRDATPKQVYDAMQKPSKDNFHNMVDVYLPDQHDIATKEEGLRRRRHVRKPR